MASGILMYFADRLSATFCARDSIQMKAPVRPGLSLSLVSVRVRRLTEPSASGRRWSVGHLRLPTNLVQMASLGPSRARGGSRRLDDWVLVSVQTLT